MLFFKLICTFILSLIFIRLIINNSTKLGLVDIPNERSSHSKVTPRGAGIGFGFAIFFSIIIGSFDIFIENWLIFLSIFLVFIVGILDDHKDASPKAKFYVIFLATFLLYLNDTYISSLGSYFGVELGLWYFALPFSMFALAGFTNALNLIDGLDGLAATISIIILGSFLYIGLFYDDLLIVNICLFTIASLIAFLLYNWNPASIFMGDSGSLLLGFIISVVAVLSLKYIHPISVFYLAAIPIVDTIIVMVRRIRKGLSPFNPDKTHIHHILVKFFNGRVKKTVFFLTLMQFLFSLVGILIAKSSLSLSNGVGTFIALIGFIGITLMLYIIFTGMKKRQKIIEKLMKKKNK